MAEINIDDEIKCISEMPEIDLFDDKAELIEDFNEKLEEPILDNDLVIKDESAHGVLEDQLMEEENENENENEKENLFDKFSKPNLDLVTKVGLTPRGENVLYSNKHVANSHIIKYINKRIKLLEKIMMTISVNDASLDNSDNEILEKTNKYITLKNNLIDLIRNKI